MKRNLFYFLSVVALSNPLAQGATLYSSGSLGSPAAAYYSDPDAGAWQASQFTVATGVSINSIVLDGFYTFTSSSDSFDIVIMAAGTLPGSELASALGVTATRTNISGNFYEFTLTLSSPLVLDAGTYWLSVANVAGEGDLWGWASSAGAGVAAASITSQTSDYTTGGTKLFSYSLLGDAVPEPTSFALAALGAVGFFQRKRA